MNSSVDIFKVLVIDGNFQLFSSPDAYIPFCSSVNKSQEMGLFSKIVTELKI